MDEEEFDNDHLSIDNEPMPDISITLPYTMWRRIAFILMENAHTGRVSYAWSIIDYMCDEVYRKECDRINKEYEEWREKATE